MTDTKNVAGNAKNDSNSAANTSQAGNCGSKPTQEVSSCTAKRCNNGPFCCFCSEYGLVSRMIFARPSDIFQAMGSSSWGRVNKDKILRTEINRQTADKPLICLECSKEVPTRVGYKCTDCWRKS